MDRYTPRYWRYLVQIDTIENLKARLAENEELAIERIKEMERLENENDLLAEEVGPYGIKRIRRASMSFRGSHVTATRTILEYSMVSFTYGVVLYTR